MKQRPLLMLGAAAAAPLLARPQAMSPDNQAHHLT